MKYCKAFQEFKDFCYYRLVNGSQGDVYGKAFHNWINYMEKGEIWMKHSENCFTIGNDKGTGSNYSPYKLVPLFRKVIFALWVSKFCD